MRAIVPASGLASIINRFDGLIVDQGCIIRHDNSLHPGALGALQHLRTAGVRIVVLASSSQSDQYNIDRLDRLGVSRDLYDRLISTGQLVQQALVAQSLDAANANRRYFLAATPEEAAAFDNGRLKRAESVEDADAVLLLSLSGAEVENPGCIAWLPAAAGRQLPLYTPKADVSSPAPKGELASGFASVLNQYRVQGGPVFLFGKPSRRIYARCLNLLDPIETDRIGSIGDQLPSDIMGAREVGIEPIFVGTGAGGLKGTTPADIAAWEADLARLCESYSIFELTVMPAFAW